MQNPEFRARLSRAGTLLLAIAVLVGVVAFNSDINLLVLLCATMLSALLVSLVLPAYLMGRLHLKRALPHEAFAGEPFEVKCRVQNPGGRRAFSVVLRDTLMLRDRPLRAFAYIDHVPARDGCAASYHVEVADRGAYAYRDAALCSRYPFGLARVTRLFRDTQELLILPQRVRLRRSLQALVRRSTSTTGAASRRSKGDEEFRSLREYAPGDGARQIHWRTTAKMGKPFVREMELDRERSALVLLDTHVPADDPVRAEALERAISFVAEWVRVTISAGGVVRLAAYAPEPMVLGPLAQPAHLHGLLVALARLQASPERTIGDLIDEPGVEFHRAMRRVAVVLDADAEARLRHVGGGMVETYQAGARSFEDAVEPIRPERVAGVYR